MIEVLLLDAMDTFVVDPFTTVVPAFFGLSYEELLAAKDPRAWVEFELGRIGEAELAADYFRDRRRVDVERLRHAITDAFVWVPGMESLVARASRALPIHVLSNYPVWYRGAAERLDTDRFLQWSFVSCDRGVRKPDPAAYTQVCSELRVAAERVLFVDDRAGNCDAGRGAGMRVERFTSANALDARLRALGVPLPPAGTHNE